MKLGHEIHYDSQDELIEALLQARQSVRDETSKEKLEVVIKSFLTGMSDEDRIMLGSQLDKRMSQWDEDFHNGKIVNVRETGGNPYAPLVDIVWPRVGGS